MDSSEKSASEPVDPIPTILTNFSDSFNWLISIELIPPFAVSELVVYDALLNPAVLYDVVSAKPTILKSNVVVPIPLILCNPLNLESNNLIEE